MSDALDELMKLEQIQQRQRFEAVHDEFADLLAQHTNFEDLFSG